MYSKGERGPDKRQRGRVEKTETVREKTGKGKMTGDSGGGRRGASGVKGRVCERREREGKLGGKELI